MQLKHLTSTFTWNCGLFDLRRRPPHLLDCFNFLLHILIHHPRQHQCNSVERNLYYFEAWTGELVTISTHLQPAPPHHPLIVVVAMVVELPPTTYLLVELWLPQIGQGCSLTHHYCSFNHGVLAPFSWCCSPQDRLCFLLSSPVVFYGVIIELLLPAPCFASSLFTLLPIFSVLLFYVDLGVLLICSQLLSSSIRHSLIASNSSVSPYFHLHN